MTRECHKQDPPTDKDSWLGKRRGFFPKGLGKLSSNEHICAYLHKTRCKDAAAEDEKDEVVGVGGGKRRFGREMPGKLKHGH